MDTSALAVLSRTAECAALVLIGYQLRAAQLFSATDAEAAQRLAGYLTLPAAVLHACASLPPVPLPALLGGALVLASSAAAAAITWQLCRARHKRERAVLAGCAVGGDASAVAVPLLEALAGPAGVVAACSALVANTLTVCGGAYLLTGSAGPAFPEAYAHEDGGSYRGEWRGLSKEGLGVYTYPSGARYEGEWRDNVKAGRGVYYFPKGGTYEGEWAGGLMSGTGLRTYSSGRVAAGRWEGGQLAAPLELWQCANAAEGAAEAALAARRVVVGGGKPSDAGQLLLAQPALWACLAGLALNTAALPLPGSLAAVAAALAPANKPLMLLSAGLLLQPLALPQPRQVRDVVAVNAVRIACGLFVAANVLALLPLLLPATDGAAALGAGSSAGGAWALLSVLAAAVVLLSPLPPAQLDFTRSFRLNEALAAACRSASALASAPLLLLLAAAVGGLRLLPLGLPLPGAAAAAAAAAAAGGGSGGGGSSLELAAAAEPTLPAAGMLVLAAAVAVAAKLVWDRLAPEQGRLLTYAGPAVAAGAAAHQAAAGEQRAAVDSSSRGRAGAGDDGGAAGGGRSSAAAGALPSWRQRHAAVGSIQKLLEQRHRQLQQRRPLVCQRLRLRTSCTASAHVCRASLSVLHA